MCNIYAQEGFVKLNSTHLRFLCQSRMILLVRKSQEYKIHLLHLIFNKSISPIQIQIFYPQCINIFKKYLSFEIPRFTVSCENLSPVGYSPYSFLVLLYRNRFGVNCQYKKKRDSPAILLGFLRHFMTRSVAQNLF